MAYKTMQGRAIDMEKLMKQNELMPAIGNMRVNARGDELGPGGVIIKRREEVVAEYYDTNPKSKINQPKADVAAVPQPPVLPVQNKNKKPNGV